MPNGPWVITTHRVQYVETSAVRREESKPPRGRQTGSASEGKEMSVKVRIPAPLRPLTNNLDIVPSDGETLSAVINGLEDSYPGLKARICEDNGEIRRFVNVYVNGEDVRFLSGLESALKSGDEVSIVPAV